MAAHDYYHLINPIMKTLKRFVLVGAPASGKGTQSSFLSETYDLKPLSTGALLRAEIAAGSQLVQRIQP